MENKSNIYKQIIDVSEIDWETWVPKEKAVLCFIKKNDKLMLIHKKTGLGKGKVNAPGGRIEPGETPKEAAVREVQEEIGLTPHNIYKVGELFFIFTDGYSLHGTVFFADTYTGTPYETVEADPFWCDIIDIPYSNMWEDDQYWLPIVLAGKKMNGFFIFNKSKMLSKRIETY